MELSRLRLGDWLCGLASVALLVLLGFAWFTPVNGVDAGAAPAYSFVGDAGVSGYRSLGWLCVALLVASALAGLVLGLLTVGTRVSVALPVAAQIFTVTFGAFVVLVLLVVLLFQPGLGAGLVNRQVAQQWPAYVGLLATLLIPVGAWVSMADDRTGARASASTPPPARPAPSPTA